MCRYNDITTLISSTAWASQLTRLNQSEVAFFKETYPHCPDDYLDYLHEIGWGMIGDGSYMIYEGLLTSDEIYDPLTANDLSHILFFGDDFQGYCAGFDTRAAWQVVEVVPTDMSVDKIGERFEAFIRSWMIDWFGAA